MQTSSVLHYVAIPTRVGQVFVLMSRAGVVDVVLDTCRAAGDPLTLLRSRFPHAELIPDDGKRGPWAAAVAARLDGTYAETEAPVDLSWPESPPQLAGVSAGVESGT